MSRWKEIAGNERKKRHDLSLIQPLSAENRARAPQLRPRNAFFSSLLTAVMAVPPPALREKLEGSIGSNGSAPTQRISEKEDVREDFEERAAIMEFDGGLSRDEAEREAWAQVSKRYRLH